MSTVHVITSYTLYVETPVELPEGKTEDDIADVWVKWGEIHLNFKDQSEFTHSESEASFDNMDWKRPGTVEVRKDANGYPDFQSEAICEEE